MEEQNHPIYTASFIVLIITFNFVGALLTWVCLNYITAVTDLTSITLTDAVVFVIIFRIIEWAKQTTFNLFFDE